MHKKSSRVTEVNDQSVSLIAKTGSWDYKFPSPDAGIETSVLGLPSLYGVVQLKTRKLSSQTLSFNMKLHDYQLNSGAT